GYVLEELGERLVEHRAAPYDGRVLIHEEPDRDDLHSARTERNDLPLRRHLGTGGSQPEHARDRIAPDIRVEYADPLAFAGQGRGKICGQRGLADAALPGADAQHVGDLRERAVG